MNKADRPVRVEIENSVDPFYTAKCYLEDIFLGLRKHNTDSENRYFEELFRSIPKMNYKTTIDDLSSDKLGASESSHFANPTYTFSKHRIFLKKEENTQGDGLYPPKSFDEDLKGLLQDTSFKIHLDGYKISLNKETFTNDTYSELKCVPDGVCELEGEVCPVEVKKHTRDIYEEKIIQDLWAQCRGGTEEKEEEDIKESAGSDSDFNLQDSSEEGCVGKRTVPLVLAEMTDEKKTKAQKRAAHARACRRRNQVKLLLSQEFPTKHKAQLLVQMGILVASKALYIEILNNKTLRITKVMRPPICHSFCSKVNEVYSTNKEIYNSTGKLAYDNSTHFKANLPDQIKQHNNSVSRSSEHHLKRKGHSG